MDYNLFMYIYTLSLKYKSVKNTMVFSTKVSSILFKTLYGLFGALILYQNPNSIYLYLLIPFMTLFIVKTMQKFIKRPRPFVSLGIKPLLPHEATGSFPSSHAASSMIIALSIGYAFKLFYIPLIVLSLFTGLSRIATGLHYPLDVLSGFFIAILIFTLSILLTIFWPMVLLSF